MERRDLAEGPRNPTAAWTCANHPDREGAGICVVCRKVVCTECLTRVEGIIHCRRCLQRRFDPRRRRGAPALAQALALLAAGIGFLVALWVFGRIGEIAASFPDDLSISVFGKREGIDEGGRPAPARPPDGAGEAR